MNTYVNVRTEDGDQRIAAVNVHGQWISVSVGIASLEDRRHSENPVGKQFDGGDWFAGQVFVDEITGARYPHGGARSTFGKFIRGFADSQRIAISTARDNWRFYSRQLSDAERARIEAGGYRSGFIEGELFAEVY